jgi:hypothetical protein
VTYDDTAAQRARDGVASAQTLDDLRGTHTRAFEAASKKLAPGADIDELKVAMRDYLNENARRARQSKLDVCIRRLFLRVGALLAQGM